MNITYPIKIRMTPAALGELSESECGRWEDNGRPDEGCWAYLIAQRHRTVLELRTEEELREVYWAICSGTFQIHMNRGARAAATKLRPFVEELADNASLLRLWPDGM